MKIDIKAGNVFNLKQGLNGKLEIWDGTIGIQGDEVYVVRVEAVKRVFVSLEGI